MKAKDLIIKSWYKIFLENFIAKTLKMAAKKSSLNVYAVNVLLKNLGYQKLWEDSYLETLQDAQWDVFLKKGGGKY